MQKTWGSFLLGSYSPTYALLLNDSVWETSPEAFSFWQQTIPDCLRSPCPFLNFFLHRFSLSPFISPTVYHLVPFTSSLLPLLIKSNSEKWYFTTSLTLNAFFFGAFFHLHLISATTLAHVSYSVSCSEGSWAADTVLNIDWRTYDNKEWLQRVCLLVSCDGFWWIAQPSCIGEVRITSRQQRGRHEQDF